jgi:Ni,Fe-hydrogenase I small subunit
MVAAGNNVFVSWWETSPETGSSESVLRVSNDAGQTFGPMIMLGVNGTISTATGNTTESTTSTPVEQGEEQLLPNEELVPTEEET